MQSSNKKAITEAQKIQYTSILQILFAAIKARAVLAATNEAGCCITILPTIPPWIVHWYTYVLPTKENGTFQYKTPVT